MKGEIVTTEVVQLDIGVRVQLYVGIRYWIPLLVTTCFDNSGFSRVETLKSLGGVFTVYVFLIRKQITMSI